MDVIIDTMIGGNSSIFKLRMRSINQTGLMKGYAKPVTGHFFTVVKERVPSFRSLISRLHSVWYSARIDLLWNLCRYIYETRPLIWTGIEKWCHVRILWECHEPTPLWHSERWVKILARVDFAASEHYVERDRAPSLLGRKMGILYWGGMGRWHSSWREKEDGTTGSRGRGRYLRFQMVL